MKWITNPCVAFLFLTLFNLALVASSFQVFMNSLKRRLLSGEFVAAAWIELGNPDVAEILVRNGGWDVIVIDGEHGVGDVETWVAVARAAQAAGAKEVILRVPDGSDTILKRVLDRGFRSIIVPMVNTVEQAQAIVRSCLYPSRGGRGYAAPIVKASHFGARTSYAKGESHQELLLFVQCEHPDAVAALSEIAAIPGIDGIFLGPNDLAGAMGHLEDLDHPDVRDAYELVEARAKQANTLLATIVGGASGRNWADLRRLGYKLAVGCNDVSLLAQSARQAGDARDMELTNVSSVDSLFDGAPAQSERVL